jgi:hypothetical protein
MASTPPAAKGMRQPQASRSWTGRIACNNSSTHKAINWPEIRVTYWKLEKKPRFSRPAISDR